MSVKGLLSEELVMERVKDVFDPEIHMSIVELGLVYGVEVSDDGVVTVTYTLTSPAAPLGAVIDGQIQDVLIDLPGVKQVIGKLTFSPPWDPRTMASDDVKMQLGSGRARARARCRGDSATREECLGANQLCSACTDNPMYSAPDCTIRVLPTVPRSLHLCDKSPAWRRSRAWPQAGVVADLSILGGQISR